MTFFTHMYLFCPTEQSQQKNVGYCMTHWALLCCMGVWNMGGGRQDVLWLLDIIKIPGPLILLSVVTRPLLPPHPPPHPPTRQHAGESQSQW